MKIFTIFKCFLRFLNLLFTILKFLVDVLSISWLKISADRVVNNGRQRQEPALLRVLLKSKADTFLFSQLSLYL